MSRSAHKEHSQPQSTQITQDSKHDIQQAIEQVDARLKHLKENVLPLHPYLLSVPTDCPYRFHKSFINCWYAGTPFNHHEEELQYMSFLPHQDPGEELLKVVGGWSDNEGNPVKEGSHTQDQNHSVADTVVQTAARKKISLKDYKVKDKSAPSIRVSKEVGDNMRTEQQVRTPSAEEKSTIHRDGDRKRKVDDTLPMKSSKHSTPPITRDGRSPSPPKRRRLSSEETKSADELQPTSTHDANKVKRSLPTLLSPTLPASKTKAPRGLPDLLSPELPKTLQIALKDTLPKRTEHVRSVLGDALGLPTDKKLVDKTLADSGRIRSDSQLSSKSLPTTANVSPHLKPAVKPSSRPVTPTTNGVRSSPGPRQRHVIVLKFGKKNRRIVQTLLRFPPRPKKVKTHRDESPTRKPHEALREMSSKPVIPPVQNEKKRPTDMPSEPATKKLKPTTATPDRARSPLIAVKTPTTSGTTRKPDPQTTPRRDLKPSVMQRMTSEGLEAKTPPIDRGRTATPVGPAQSRASPAAASTPAGRESDRAAWNELNTRFHKLGRQLKGEAQTLAASKSETDQILSVVNHVEALLCFMINLSAQSHSRASGPGWETIMPYFIFVFKASRRYRHLHGLVIQLGAVCRQIWHNHNIEKLYRDPLPDESNSAPTPGSDGNTKTDDNEKYKRRYLDFKTQLVQNSRELQSAWLEGSRYLSPYLLEQEYPRTWSRRTKDTSRRAIDRINPHHIDKEFYLPLDPNSSVFEACRFATSLIEEWTTREKVAWRSKIEL